MTSFLLNFPYDFLLLDFLPTQSAQYLLISLWICLRNKFDLRVGENLGKETRGRVADSEQPLKLEMGQLLRHTGSHQPSTGQ